MTYNASEADPSMPEVFRVPAAEPGGSRTPGPLNVLLALVATVLLIGAGLVVLGRYEAAIVFGTVLTAVAGLVSALAALCRDARGS